MDYYVLCFGRTDFTRYTVESIWHYASEAPRIVLINNGWNASIVPPLVLEYWMNFVDSSLRSGRIASVIDHATPVVGLALNAFQQANSHTHDSLYWISDNDCVIGSGGYELLARTLMETYPELPKLGVDFHRLVSRSYCQGYESIARDIEGYLWQFDDVRVVPAGAEADYCDLSGDLRQNYRDDSSINNNKTDTTLSVVRKGIAVTQGENRISDAIAGVKMLHIGYLESLYWSDDEIAVCEMLHYMNLRPLVLTEWAADYENRKQQYIANLLHSQNGNVIERYNQMLGRSGHA